VKELTKERGLHLLTQMIRIRRLEEACAQLYQQEKIRGFLHLYIGEEAVAAGMMDHLGPEDPVFATYREHGHALLRGVPATTIMAEMFGKLEGCSRGRGGSMHLFDRATKFCGGNAIVGGHLPMAVGAGLAAKLSGSGAISVVFFGEGAMAEGEFHESMNLAGLWQLPVLFCCENNGYAMGTALARSESETNLAVKAAAYEVPAWSVDGMDVLAVDDAAARAVAEVRGGGPLFLELKTYRFRAHSMFDPELYREKAEVELWKERDPIVTFTATLRERGLLDDEELASIEKEARAEIDDAIEFADAGSLEPVATLAEYVYSPTSTVVTGGAR
jgi:pyruvate dehydrogenase E1 component alpha subunit